MQQVLGQDLLHLPKKSPEGLSRPIFDGYSCYTFHHDEGLRELQSLAYSSSPAGRHAVGLSVTKALSAHGPASISNTSVA